MIGTRDVQIAQQIGIFLVGRIDDASSFFWIQRFYPHVSHQPLDPLVIHKISTPMKFGGYSAVSIKGHFVPNIMNVIGNFKIA